MDKDQINYMDSNNTMEHMYKLKKTDKNEVCKWKLKSGLQFPEIRCISVPGYEILKYANNKYLCPIYNIL